MLALEDQLLVGTAARRFLSIDVKNGRDRWDWSIGGDISGLPAADDRRIYFASRDNILRALDRRSGNLRWKANLPSRPAGGPLLTATTVLMPMVSSEIAGFEPESGKPAVTVRAAGEIGTQPFVRAATRATLPLLITVSREGQLQGFGRRFEPPPQALPVPPIGAPALP
jgi:outer membrane protein assembly factor BamB